MEKSQLTNRRSRGPCKTDAVTVFVKGASDSCIRSIWSSVMAEGAIFQVIIVWRGVGVGWAGLLWFVAGEAALTVPG